MLKSSYGMTANRQTLTKKGECRPYRLQREYGRFCTYWSVSSKNQFEIINITKIHNIVFVSDFQNISVALYLQRNDEHSRE